MRADISEAGGSQERVYEGVYGNVAIGVSRGPLVERDIDTTQDELGAGDQSVDVVAYAYSHHWTNIRRAIISANSISSVVVILIFDGSPLNVWTREPIASTNELSSVTSRPPDATASSKRSRRKNCGSLNGHQL